MNRLRKLCDRAHTLVTRRLEWTDTTTGETGSDKLDLSDAWAIAGIHSHNWRWVQRFGALNCGCTRNPLTRRMVLFDFDCQEHGIASILDDDEP